MSLSFSLAQKSCFWTVDKETSFVEVCMERIVEHIIVVKDGKMLDIPTFLLLEEVGAQDSRLDIDMIVKVEVVATDAD